MDNMTTAERLLAKTEKKKEDELLKKEELEQWKDCVNRLVQTSDGKSFFEKYLKHMMLFVPKEEINPQLQLLVNARQDFYLRHVRPYMDKTNRNNLE